MFCLACDKMSQENLQPLESGLLTLKSPQEGLDSQWEGWQPFICRENSGSATARELIRIWTRGQILPQKSKFSELPKNKWVCSPRRHEPNAIRFVSNGRRERKLSRSVRIAKQVKKNVLTGQAVLLTWQRPYC
jgi:hypothetical protein